jgi:hypothetical protein
MPSTASHAVDIAQAIRDIERVIPLQAIRSTVTVVASKNQVLRQLGSGTLLAVADQRFLVTAGHVVRSAANDEMTLGVAGADDGHFVATIQGWRLSPSDDREVGSDPYDVAIYEFSLEQRTRFRDENFIRIADVLFDFDVSTGYFTLFGFPAMWSNNLTDHDNEATFKSKLLQYSTVALQGTAHALDGYDPSTHLLLDASPAETTDHDGQPNSFRTASGHSAHMPQDLSESPRVSRRPVGLSHSTVVV